MSIRRPPGAGAASIAGRSSASAVSTTAGTVYLDTFFSAAEYILDEFLAIPRQTPSAKNIASDSSSSPLLAILIKLPRNLASAVRLLAFERMTIAARLVAQLERSLDDDEEDESEKVKGKPQQQQQQQQDLHMNLPEDNVEAASSSSRRQGVIIGRGKTSAHTDHHIGTRLLQQHQQRKHTFLHPRQPEADEPAAADVSQMATILRNALAENTKTLIARIGKEMTNEVLQALRSPQVRRAFRLAVHSEEEAASMGVDNLLHLTRGFGASASASASAAVKRGIVQKQMHQQHQQHSTVSSRSVLGVLDYSSSVRNNSNNNNNVNNSSSSNSNKMNNASLSSSSSAIHVGADEADTSDNKAAHIQFHPFKHKRVQRQLSEEDGVDDDDDDDDDDAPHGDAYQQQLLLLSNHAYNTNTNNTHHHTHDMKESSTTAARIWRRKLSHLAAPLEMIRADRPLPYTTHDSSDRLGHTTLMNRLNKAKPEDTMSYYQVTQLHYGKGRRGSTSHAGSGAWDEVYSSPPPPPPPHSVRGQKGVLPVSLFTAGGGNVGPPDSGDHKQQHHHRHHDHDDTTISAPEHQKQLKQTQQIRDEFEDAEARFIQAAAGVARSSNITGEAEAEAEAEAEVGSAAETSDDENQISNTYNIGKGKQQKDTVERNRTHNNTIVVDNDEADAASTTSSSLLAANTSPLITHFHRISEREVEGAIRGGSNSSRNNSRGAPRRTSTPSIVLSAGNTTNGLHTTLVPDSYLHQYQHQHDENDFHQENGDGIEEQGDLAYDRMTQNNNNNNNQEAAAGEKDDQDDGGDKEEEEGRVDGDDETDTENGLVMEAVEALLLGHQEAKHLSVMRQRVMNLASPPPPPPPGPPPRTAMVVHEKYAAHHDYPYDELATNNNSSSSPTSSRSSPVAAALFSPSSPFSSSSSSAAAGARFSPTRSAPPMVMMMGEVGTTSSYSASSFSSSSLSPSGTSSSSRGGGGQASGILKEYGDIQEQMKQQTQQQHQAVAIARSLATAIGTAVAQKIQQQQQQQQQQYQQPQQQYQYQSFTGNQVVVPPPPHPGSSGSYSNNHYSSHPPSPPRPLPLPFAPSVIAPSRVRPVTTTHEPRAQSLLARELSKLALSKGVLKSADIGSTSYPSSGHHQQQQKQQTIVASVLGHVPIPTNTSVSSPRVQSTANTEVVYNVNGRSGRSSL